MEEKQNKKEEIQCDKINSKINFLQKMLTQKISISPEEKHAILKTKAQALATEKKEKTIQNDFLEIIVFRLAEELYAVESSFVREVYQLKDFTTLPGIPAFVLGIINVRGQIISIINLKKFFNLPEKGISELNKVIILKNESMEFGILADTIDSTYSIALNSILTSFSNNKGINNEYIKGVTNEHLIILDARKILNDEKLIIYQVKN